MGWLHIEGAPPEAFVPTDPGTSGRESFSEVFLTQQLRQGDLPHQIVTRTAIPG